MDDDHNASHVADIASAVDADRFEPVETPAKSYAVQFNGHSYRIYLPNANSDHIQGLIAKTGRPYEAEMLADIESHIVAGDLVVDVGANIGNHSLYFVACGAQVVAIEPNRELAPVIAESLALNGWRQLGSVLNFGAGRQHQTASMGARNPMNLGGMKLELSEGDIEVRTLDALLENRIPAVIKIDVEGMELDVLVGARQVIARARPFLYIECLQKESFQGVHDWLEHDEYVLLNTFNATPTHLFAPVERLDRHHTLRSSRFRYGAVLRTYDMSQGLQATKEALKAANEKYRTASQQHSTLKEQLDTANQKYREATQRESAYKDTLRQGEAAHQAVVMQLAEAQSRADSLSTAWTHEKKARGEEERQRLRLESEAQALNQKLELGEQAYRLATQQSDELKESLAREVVARQDTLTQLLEVQSRSDALSAALATERAMRAEQEAQRLRLDAKAQGLQEQLDRAQQKFQEANEQVTQLGETLESEQAARQKMLTQLSELQSRADSLSTAWTHEKKARGEEERQRLRLESEAQALNQKLELGEQAYRLATRQSDELKESLAREVVARQDTLTQLLEVQSRSDALSAALATERAMRAEQEAQRLRLDAKAQGLQEQLDRAQQKFQEANEQVTQLGETLEGEKATHQKTLTQLAGIQDRADSLFSQLMEEKRESANQEVLRTQLQKEVESIQEQLDRAHQKYLEASGQFATLRDAFAQEQADRESLLQRLEERARKLEGELQRAVEEYQSASRETQAINDQLVQETDAHQATRKRLAESDAKCESVSVRWVDEKERRSNAEAKLTQIENTHRQTQERLDSANQKYREVTRNERDLKDRLSKSQQALIRAKQDIAHARNQILSAESQVARTRGTLSFQLGYALIHATHSVGQFLTLPKTLWNLRKEALLRRARRISGPSRRFKPQKESLPAAIGSKAPIALPSPIQLPNRLERDLREIKVACIMDEFSFESFRPECKLFPLSVNDWNAELDTFKPDFLLIESAWRGKDNAWGNKVGHASDELMAIVRWCREHHVPTSFWNKEDPVHFETFLTTAKNFDLVFTTDIDCIHRYKAALGHDRVYLLPFACQPRTTNPFEKYERKDAFAFAGAFYARYPERTRDLANFSEILSSQRPLEIYDRNHGKNDPNYQFPEMYRPYIVGNLPFDQIDKAYKGYRYAINLNSIKQSQSMFARRVFDLLASNTVTVSNYSRGVRLLFGDLVIASDEPQEIIQRLAHHCSNDLDERKFRLAGLRKVMLQHTYQDRLAYIVSKLREAPCENQLPRVAMIGYAETREQVTALIGSFKRQTYSPSCLILVVPRVLQDGISDDDARIRFLPPPSLGSLRLKDVLEEGTWLAGIVANDYYGPNYLMDLALATRYSDVDVIGKVTHFQLKIDGELILEHPSAQYREARFVAARRSILKASLIGELNTLDWVRSLSSLQLDQGRLLGVDEFNYCENGAGQATLPAGVDDLAGLDTGIDLADLLQHAEAIQPAAAVAHQAPVITGAEWTTWLPAKLPRTVILAASDDACDITSMLGDGKHEYLYATRDLRPDEFGFEDRVRIHLDVTPGLNLQIVVLFLDTNKQRISHVIRSANCNHEVLLPASTEWIRFGLRVYGNGSARVNALVMGHRPLQPSAVVGQAEHLLVTNHYPSYDDLYRNGFVHTRVKAYRERGVMVDVFRLRTEQPTSFHEYQDVDVTTGSQQALHQLLGSGRYKSVLVHFMDPAMWEVLRHHVDRVRVIVWVHGAEIQPWHRRDFNFETEQERQLARAQSDTRMAFWRELLQPMPANLKLVFVSRYFSEEVMEDLGFRLRESSYAIIHNPIDTDLFSYVPKPPEQRKKILSIRPYASRVYANDLSVAAILELSKEPFFPELEFRMIGDGKLFESVLEPLRHFPNVVIERRFVSREEIAQLHKEYGVFLCPTRMDTQGVSRDEAMASGLVPVTNAVAAVPEFVDSTSGMLASPDSATGIATFLRLLHGNQKIFTDLSKNAAVSTRKSRSHRKVIHLELNLFNPPRKVAVK